MYIAVFYNKFCSKWQELSLSILHLKCTNNISTYAQKYIQPTSTKKVYKYIPTTHLQNLLENQILCFGFYLGRDTRR